MIGVFDRCFLGRADEHADASALGRDPRVSGAGAAARRQPRRCEPARQRPHDSRPQVRSGRHQNQLRMDLSVRLMQVFEGIET